MLTFCLPSRTKGNLSSNLDRLLQGITTNTTEDEKRQVEVIIKFDSDDIVPDFIVNSKYPFPVKYVQYERGAGRYDLHTFINYIATLRDDRSKFLMTIADDFIITRNGFVSEILDNPHSYRIIGGAQSPIFGEYINIPLGANYRNRKEWEWSIGAYCPIIGNDILKCIFGVGVSPSTDAWAVALALAVYKNYGVNVWKPLRSFYYRDEAYDKPALVGTQPEHHKQVNPYNTLDMMHFRDSFNPRFWEILESQAKNIYLNMKHDRVI